MAALQKIRSKGALLIAVIGLALFAFIAQEVFQSLQSSSNESRQRIGEVNGKHLTAQEFQNMVAEYENVVKFQTGQNTLTEEQTTQIKDQVWNSYVSNQLINQEAEKIGLTVTDAEIQAILQQGTNPLLRQTPFTNEKTGMFDVNTLKKFLTDYETMKTQADQMPAQYIEYYQNLYNFWMFVEKTLREQTLIQKYQALMVQSLVSNPVAAKMSFDNRNTERELLLAAIPYNTINDEEVVVTDGDLKAKYNELKELFRQPVETRDVKFVDVEIVASEADKADLSNELNEYSTRLQEGEATTSVMRDAKSQIAYSEVPVSKKALPSDIAAQVDSMSVGTVQGPFFSAGDNTLNVVKMISKSTLPDSIEYRQIQVGGADIAASRKTADSIYTALKEGAVFDSIAKIYGQTGEKIWITSTQYEGGLLDADNAKYINTMNSKRVNGLSNVEMTQGKIIIEVTGRKNPIQKYNLAVIKRPIVFSKETRSEAYNNFSQFVAANTTLEEIEANAAKSGYRVQTREDMSNEEHGVAGIRGTQDVLRWIFDQETKPGSVSQLYECGDNDRLLIVAVTDVHKAGYRDMSSAKEELTTEVIRDKKAAKIIESLKDVNTIAGAKGINGARVEDRKSTRLNSSHEISSRMPSSACKKKKTQS